jgi:hypothetical protein
MNIAFASMPAPSRRSGPLDPLGHGYLELACLEARPLGRLARWLPPPLLSCSISGKLGVDLRAGESVSLRRAAGITVRCEEGRLWITEEGLADDTALVAGQSMRLVRNGKALILALRDCHVTMESGAGRDRA